MTGSNWLITAVLGVNDDGSQDGRNSRQEIRNVAVNMKMVRVNIFLPTVFDRTDGLGYCCVNNRTRTISQQRSGLWDSAHTAELLR